MELTQIIELRNNRYTIISFNVIPPNISPESYFSNLQDMESLGQLIVQNDGDYWIPSSGIDQIGEINHTEGYSVYVGITSLAYDAPIYFTVTGEEVGNIPVTMNPVEVNYIPYHGTQCVSWSEVMGGISSSGASDGLTGEFPTEMCPGVGYEIFIVGMDDVTFNYPDSSFLIVDPNYYVVPTCGVCGDVDGDGFVTMDDFWNIYDIVFSGASPEDYNCPCAADFNNDNIIDSSDMMKTMHAAGGQAGLWQDYDCYEQCNPPPNEPPVAIITT